MGKIERLWLSTIKLYYSKKCKILHLTIVKTTAIASERSEKTAYKTLKPFFLFSDYLKRTIQKQPFTTAWHLSLKKELTRASEAAGADGHIR